jgi:glucokinase
VSCLAADVGGTKIAAARVSDEGVVEGSVLTVPTPAAQGPQAVLEALVAVLRRLDRRKVSAVGVSSAGVIDSSAGTVRGSTASIRGWAGTAISEYVIRALGCPVFVLGDGHAFAVGESVYGSARDADSLLVLAAGTGVGGSYVSSRQPLLGSHWAGGHFGHVPVPQAVGLDCDCGRSGHLESIGSGAGMVRWYHRNGGDPQVTAARELFARADAEPTAARAVELGASALGTAAGGLANAFDPDVVVIAGGLSQAGARWEEPLRASFDQTLIPILAGMPLVTSEADAWLALRGVAYYAQMRKGTP